MKTITLSERSRDKMLHIEAPGCIVNITMGLTNAKGEAVTRVDVRADGDRYMGDPQWWARGEVAESGSTTLVVQTTDRVLGEVGA